MLAGDKDAKNPTALRIGVQEMTRYGMKEDEMGELADLMKAGLQGKIVKDEVIKLRSRFTTYTLPDNQVMKEIQPAQFYQGFSKFGMAMNLAVSFQLSV